VEAFCVEAFGFNAFDFNAFGFEALYFESFRRCAIAPWNDVCRNRGFAAETH